MQTLHMMPDQDAHGYRRAARLGRLEILKFSYHGHSIIFGHHLVKFFVVRLISTNEDNTAHIYLTRK